MNARLIIWASFLFFSLTSVDAQDTGFDTFLNQSDYFFSTYVNEGLVDYSGLKEDANWTAYVSDIEERSVDQLSEDEQLAFYINAYNAMVIDQVLSRYPITSVNAIPNFFTQKSIKVSDQKLSLDGLEKMILKRFNDSRLHFVLVCGAVSCPRLISEAYRPDGIAQQIEQVTKAAFKDARVFSKLGKEVFVSKIFSWYEKDFGDLKEYINKYIEKPLESENIDYLVYDWSLNDQHVTQALSGNNSNRYVSSATVPQGGWELKLFNNFYSETYEKDNSRNTFYTASLSALYGASSNLNVGISARYRRVNTEIGNSNFLHVFNGNDTGQHRTGITAIGPQIRWAPSHSLKGFSIQSAYLFPVGDTLSQGPYIDWDGASWFNQFFYDQSLGDRFSLFTELGFAIENITLSNRVMLPATVILSYFPVRNLTVYGLANYAKFVHGENGAFWQLGQGVKYQFTKNFELELLYTYFGSTKLNTLEGEAATYNLGLRINL